MTSSPNPFTLEQFLILYISAQEGCQPTGLYHGNEAENILLNILQRAYKGGILVSALPKNSIKWILQKECLFEMNKKMLLVKFRADALGGPTNCTILTQLVEEDDCVTEVVLSLVSEEVERHHEDEIRLVANGITRMVRGSWNCTEKFHSRAIVSTLRRFMLLQGPKARDLTVISCVELLFHLLVNLNEEMVMMDEGAWLDIGKQVCGSRFLDMCSFLQLKVFGDVTDIQSLLSMRALGRVRKSTPHLVAGNCSFLTLLLSIARSPFSSRVGHHVTFSHYL